MKKIILILTFIVISFANNWILEESHNKSMYMIIPIRTNKEIITGFEIKNIAIYDKSGKRIYNYGFSIKKGSSIFKFNKNDIDRYYLRPTRKIIYAGEPIVTWQCKKNYFQAIIQKNNKKEIFNKNYKGLKNFYPKQTIFYARYIKITKVHGKKKIQIKKRPVEIWGLANSLKNAKIMVNFYKKEIINSMYYYIPFKITKNLYIEKQLLNDKINVNINSKIKEKAWKKKINTSLHKPVIDLSLNICINNDCSSINKKVYANIANKYRYGQREQYWKFPVIGWENLNLDKRYLKLYLSLTKTSYLWISYKPAGNEKDFHVKNVIIPKCE